MKVYKEQEFCVWEIGRRGGKVGFTLASRIEERSIILASGAVFSEVVGILLWRVHILCPQKNSSV